MSVSLHVFSPSWFIRHLCKYYLFIYELTQASRGTKQLTKRLECGTFALGGCYEKERIVKQWFCESKAAIWFKKTLVEMGLWLFEGMLTRCSSLRDIQKIGLVGEHHTSTRPKLVWGYVTSEVSFSFPPTEQWRKTHLSPSPPQSSLSGTQVWRVQRKPDPISFLTAYQTYDTRWTLPPKVVYRSSERIHLGYGGPGGSWSSYPDIAAADICSTYQATQKMKS